MNCELLGGKRRGGGHLQEASGKGRLIRENELGQAFW